VAWQPGSAFCSAWTRQRGERRDGLADVRFLDVMLWRLAALEQGVAAESGHDSHAGAPIARPAAGRQAARMSDGG